ncbi:putative membrane protein [Evansella vedderi]|uniref:Membrane protein n=1 Tax=Evansella vedderi TaxID=38282 RepID=A0ABU0A1Y9_9BACI|nr:DUF2254 domain-containing protein [Evansella vedderi]MDQ0256991.1 putative membrane protein [Evansella vedderi]
MWASKVLFTIRSSFWYIPSKYGVLAALFAYISIYIDSYLMSLEIIYRITPSIFFADIDLTRTILSSISASLLTMTTITFSTILVVLTTFLSEYSPRTLQNFITDVSTQRVMGVFVGGFVYSILLLLFLRETEMTTRFIVPSFAVLFSIICLLVFIFFIHHVSRWMQVSNLIHNITMNLMEKIDRDYENVEDVHGDAPWEDWESEEIKLMEPRQIFFNQTGYIKFIDMDGLLQQATEDDCIVQVEKNISDYVDENTTVLSIWSLSGSKELGDYEKYISIGRENAPVDSLQFGLTKIVEVALRALSPGINDPNTAINCIDNLGKILARLGGKYLPRSYHNDKHRNLRLILMKPDFEDYLYKCFYQIRQSGFHDISVLASGIKALTLIARKNSKEVKDVVWEFTEYVLEGIKVDEILTLDRKYLNKKFQELAEATGRGKLFKGL